MDSTKVLRTGDFPKATKPSDMTHDELVSCGHSAQWFADHIEGIGGFELISEIEG